MRISHAIKGGNYKRRAQPNLGLLSSGYSGTKCSGLLASHRPFTLAVLVLLKEQSIIRMDSVACLSICMYPELSGELAVSVTLVV